MLSLMLATAWKVIWSPPGVAHAPSLPFPTVVDGYPTLQPAPPLSPLSASCGKGNIFMRKEDRDMEKDWNDLIDGWMFVVLQDFPSDVFHFLSALYNGL